MRESRFRRTSNTTVPTHTLASPFYSKKAALVLAILLLTTGLIAGFYYLARATSNQPATLNGYAEYHPNPMRSQQMNDAIQSLRAEVERSRTTNGSTENSSNSNTTVTINGENIPMPQNGTLNYQTPTGTGSMNVQIESHSSQTSDAANQRSRNRSNISIDSSSRSSVSESIRQEVDIE